MTAALFSFLYALAQTAPAPVTAPVPPAAAPVTAPADATAATADDDLAGLLTLSMAERSNRSVSAVSKYEQDSRRAPANVTVINRAEMRAHRYRTLPDVLRSVTGMYVVDDTMYSFLNVRGYGLSDDFNNRVLVLLNGHVLNAFDGSQGYNLHDFNLDLATVDHIEVIKGPGSAIYGNGAFFAVINIVTVAPDEPGATGVSITGGFPDKTIEGAASAGGVHGDFRYLVSAHGTQVRFRPLTFDAYDSRKNPGEPRAIPGGRVNNNDNHVAAAYATLGWREFTLSTYASHRLGNLPTAPYYADFNAKSDRISDERYYADLAWVHEFSLAQVTARAYGDLGKYEDFLPYKDDGGLYRDRIQNSLGGGEVRSVWLLPASNRLLAGVEMARHRPFIVSDYRAAYQARLGTQKPWYYTQTNAYLQDEWRPLGALAITLGGQVNANTLYGAAFLPRASIVATPLEQHTVKLLYSEGIRQPTPWERFFFDETTYLANLDVESERLRTVEAIYEVFPLPELRLQVAAHADRYDKLIEQEAITKPDQSVWFQFVNNRGFVSRGLEVEAGTVLPGEGTLNASIVVQRVIALDEHKWADYSPRMLGNVLVKQPLPAGLSAAVDGHFVGDRRTLETGAHTGSYWLWNAAAVWATPVDRLEASLRLWNVFDRRYENPAFSPHLPLVKVPEPGRTVFARIDYGF
jgi:iron complex outermembrane receptor protein